MLLNKSQSDRLLKIAKEWLNLVKANPAPSRIGEVSPDGQQIGIKYGSRAPESKHKDELVWETHPKFQAADDAQVEKFKQFWTNPATVPDPVMRSQYATLADTVAKDPARHVRVSFEGEQHAPRARHIAHQNSNGPATKLKWLKASPDDLHPTLVFKAMRHGIIRGDSDPGHRRVHSWVVRENKPLQLAGSTIRHKNDEL
jgi:hypothetical protein